MAKSEGRGWRKFVPTPVTIVKVFLASVVIHAATSFIYPKLPAQVQSHWPRT